MFVYCGNNPVIYVDETGTYYTSGQIHDFVVEDICNNGENLTNKGTYIKYKIPVFRNRTNRKIGKLSTYGFCDFYNTETGEAWEVKRFGGGISCAVDSALAQLTNYVKNGVLNNNPTFELIFGGTHTTIPGRYFTKMDSDGEGIYFIYYWDLGNGIIYYDYCYFPSPREMWKVLGIGISIVLGAGVAASAGIVAGIASGLSGAVALLP